jgi:hypothetical protein
MLMEFPHAEARARTAAPRLARIERQLARFRAGVQPRVRALAARHPWIADLAVSFPAVLFALAYPRRGRSRDHALRLAIEGASLATVAGAAGAPMWMRGFPPHAFEAALPRLPDGAEVRRRIANHLPRVWRDAPRWIESVALAADVANDDVALWFAREHPKPPRKRGHYAPPDRRRLVAFWAWHTLARTVAGSLSPHVWNEEMTWAPAQAAAVAWVDALNTHLWLDESGVDDVWGEPGIVDGYEFSPLRTAADLAAESDAMQNCVRSYGAELGENYARLWSIRKDGERVATMHLGVAFPAAPYPHIVELAAHANAAAAPDVWLAARRWLHAQDTPDADPKRFGYAAATGEPKRWTQLWKPYWLAKRRIPAWLPLRFGSVFSI